MGVMGLRFIFDYIDPGSYLGWALLERLQGGSRTPIAVDWVPLELRPPPAPPLDPRSEDWSRLTSGVAAVAVAEGIPFLPPPSLPWTRKAHELAYHAREKGCFPVVHQTLFEAHFSRGIDIGRVDRLVELAEGCGLDPSETRTVLGVDRFRDAVEGTRVRLLREGIRGIPILESNGERLEGLKDPLVLQAFLARGSDSTSESEGGI